MSWTMGNLALCAATAAKHICVPSCSSLREGGASSAAFAVVSMMVCSRGLGLGGCSSVLRLCYSLSSEIGEVPLFRNWGSRARMGMWGSRVSSARPDLLRLR